MSTASLARPTRKTALWLTEAEGALIDRQIQNTEVLTLTHQIEQCRLQTAGNLNRAIDALLHGDQKQALRLLNETVVGPVAKQGVLLKDLERVEQQDVRHASQDGERYRTLKTLDAWRPNGDAR